MNDTMKDLMIHVERAVRPVRACACSKDRMREELLAHLTDIYQQELTRTTDERAACKAAVKRFGESASLTAELQDSVPRLELFDYRIEQCWAWRPPETALRYSLRLGVKSFLLNLCLAAPVIATAYLANPRAPDLVTRQRIGITFLAVISMNLFLLGFLYFKMRDALCSAASAARSPGKAVVLGLLMVATVLASAPLFTVVGIGDFWLSREILAIWAPAAIFLPLCFAGFAWKVGPKQLRHVEWERLDIA